jgi:hypothetical protein
LSTSKFTNRFQVDAGTTQRGWIGGANISGVGTGLA